jgi:predicted DNA-binding transcriptional regulator AlpA
MVQTMTDEQAKQGAEPLLTLEQVLEIVPVGRTTLMRMIDRGDFPPGRFITANKRVWSSSSLASWQGSLPTQSPRKKRARNRPPRS